MANRTHHSSCKFWNQNCLSALPILKNSRGIMLSSILTTKTLPRRPNKLGECKQILDSLWRCPLGTVGLQGKNYKHYSKREKVEYHSHVSTSSEKPLNHSSTHRRPDANKSIILYIKEIVSASTLLYFGSENTLFCN